MPVCEDCGKAIESLHRVRVAFLKQEVTLGAGGEKLLEVGASMPSEDEETLWCCPKCGSEVFRTGSKLGDDSVEDVKRFLRGEA